MHRLPINNGSPNGRLTIEYCLLWCRWHDAVNGGRINNITINTVDYCIGCLTQAGCTLHDSIQHRLNVSRRASDHAKYLARRRLLLEGLAQVAVARLQFLQQTGVLDGN